MFLIYEDGLNTSYVYDNNRIIAEYDATGLIREYVHGNSIDEILYMIKGANVYYYYYDGLGSVRAITNDTGATIETYAYDVYGKPTIYDASGTKITESQIGNRNYFTGREFDFASGLYYYRARYYNPELGRFMSPDPVGPAISPNLYTYCKNNPINWRDPLGLLSLKETLDWIAERWRDFEELRKSIPPGTPITSNPYIDLGVERHKKTGRPLVIWENGKTIRISPNTVK